MGTEQRCRRGRSGRRCWRTEYDIPCHLDRVITTMLKTLHGQTRNSHGRRPAPRRGGGARTSTRGHVVPCQALLTTLHAARGVCFRARRPGWGPGGGRGPNLTQAHD